MEQQLTATKTQYFAIIAEDKSGPAYGAGISEAAARRMAQESGFDDSGTCIEITGDSFDAIMDGDPDAVVELD